MPPVDESDAEQILGAVSKGRRNASSSVPNGVVLQPGEPERAAASAVSSPRRGAAAGRVAKVLPVVIVDNQEKLPLTPYFKASEVTVEVAHLETGDYSVGGGTHLLAIERKSLQDLINCTTADRERFMDQMRRLKNYRCRFLIVEADEQDIADGIYESRVHPASVLGTLMTVQVRWGINVIHANGQRDAARRVSWICRKVHQLQQEKFFEEV